MLFGDWRDHHVRENPVVARTAIERLAIEIPKDDGLSRKLRNKLICYAGEPMKAACAVEV